LTVRRRLTMFTQIKCWLAVTWLALAAPALAQDKSSIQAENMRFSAAFNSGDYAAAASVYTEDAYMLPPGADIVKGRANIQSFLMKAGETLGNIALTTLEVPSR
jgi:ketosteroid isomerase-like protein